MFHRKVSKSLIPIAFASLGFGGVALAQPGQQQQQPGQQQPGQQQQPGMQQPGQQQQPGMQQQQQQQKRMEKQGLSQIHAVNQGAVDLGLIGMNRAQNEDVRDFANTIVEEHQEADRNLMKKAQERNIDVAGTQEAQQAQQQLEQQHQQDIQRLEQAQGQQFDQQYIGLVVQSHEQALQQLRQQQQQIRDPNLREVVDERVSKVQEHLQKAQELQQEVGQQQQQQPRGG